MKFVIEDLVKSYGKENIVIDGASFTFEEGKIYGLLGRNGAGKTTLFNCINEDIPFEGGEFYFIDDMDNEAVDGRKDALKRKVAPEDIGYVLSTPTVPEFLTGREFLKFFLDINPNAGSLSDIDKYFDLVRLSDKDVDKLMKNYSHGMKNKMQMLVNMLAQPKLLLLDEPLTSLDVVVAEEMKGLLRNFKDGRITIFSTHILDLAVDLCDEIVLLSKGKLEAVDHAALDNEGFKERIIELLKDEDREDDLQEELSTVETFTVEKEETSPMENPADNSAEAGAGWNSGRFEN